MPRFCANLTFLFRELPFLERFGAARAAGFDAVEVLFPYDCPAGDIRSRLEVNALELTLINGPPPSYSDAPRGFAAIPGGEERFRHDFRRTLRYADLLGARIVHLMSGVADGAAARAALVANLCWACDAVPGRTLTIEPINTDDMPGYFLHDFDLAKDIIKEVGAPNLRLQFDAFHAHKITGDVAGTWARVADVVGHVQIAGFPGRSEPMGGEIDYPAFFALLDRSRYAGRVSGEYVPAAKTEDGLAWARVSA